MNVPPIQGLQGLVFLVSFGELFSNVSSASSASTVLREQDVGGQFQFFFSAILHR
jgi:hypothetical protein